MSHWSDVQMQLHSRLFSSRIARHNRDCASLCPVALCFSSLQLPVLLSMNCIPQCHHILRQQQYICRAGLIVMQQQLQWQSLASCILASDCQPSMLESGRHRNLGQQARRKHGPVSDELLKSWSHSLVPSSWPPCIAVGFRFNCNPEDFSWLDYP